MKTKENDLVNELKEAIEDKDYKEAKLILGKMRKLKNRTQDEAGQ